MNAITANWKTSLTGAIVICLGLLKAVLGIEIPGFTMDIGPAMATGIGLLLAKDHNVTGGSVKQ